MRAGHTWLIGGSGLLLLAACTSAPPPPPPAVFVPASQSLDCSGIVFDIYFEIGSAGLSAPAALTIDEIVTREAGCTYSRVEIEGHADVSGTREANAAISVRRAENVAERLIAKGIDAERISVRGVGEADAITDLGQIQPMNRRTQVRLIP
jgi:OOP family OmpA-OmpF porin